jgi:MoaA/NifB/PqqE/SkfB family radical SAM enzyme
MTVKYYNNLASPFLQSKILIHRDKLNLLKHESVVNPITCEIDLADGFCNNSCPFCFFGTNIKTKPVFIDKVVIKKVIKQLSEHGIKGIEFVGGGEPTTHPDFADIISYAYSTGIELGLITNGLLLNRFIDILKKFNYIRISLDAATSITYQKTHGVNSFNRVLENINSIDFSYKKEHIGIAYLIVPENVTEIENAADLAKSLDVRFIQYRPYTALLNSKNALLSNMNNIHAQIQRCIDKYKDCDLQIFDGGIKWVHIDSDRHYEKCVTSCLSAVIKANGDVPLCSLSRDDKDKIIGNIYGSNFFDFWGSPHHKNLIENIDLHNCRRPCKYDNYNIMYYALTNDLLHENFI